MKGVNSVVPVYPTGAQFWRLPSWSAKWRDCFPFSARSGMWTFSGRVALYHGLPSSSSLSIAQSWFRHTTKAWRSTRCSPLVTKCDTTGSMSGSSSISRTWSDDWTARFQPST